LATLSAAHASPGGRIDVAIPTILRWGHVVVLWPAFPHVWQGILLERIWGTVMWRCAMWRCGRHHQQDQHRSMGHTEHQHDRQGGRGVSGAGRHKAAGGSRRTTVSAFFVLRSWDAICLSTRLDSPSVRWPLNVESGDTESPRGPWPWA
jgi:hypothetical protein